MKTSHNFNIVVQVRSMQRMVFDRKRNKWNFVETYETNETYFVKLYQGSSICSNIWGMSLVTCISVKMLDWVFIVLSFRQRDVLHAHVGLFNRSRFRNVRKKIFMNWIVKPTYEVKPNDFDNLSFQCFSWIKISKNHYMEKTLFKLVFGWTFFLLIHGNVRNQAQLKQLILILYIPNF